MDSRFFSFSTSYRVRDMRFFGVHSRKTGGEWREVAITLVFSIKKFSTYSRSQVEKVEGWLFVREFFSSARDPRAKLPARRAGGDETHTPTLRESHI